MPRALEIPIEVTRLDRAVDSVRSLSTSVRGVGDASKSSAAALQQSWSQAMQRIAGDQRRYLTVSGPAQRLQRAVRAREAAAGTGDAAALFDANAAVRRAQVAMERERRMQAGGPGFVDRATTALRSTRFNVGGVSPLIGRTADLLGLPTEGAAGLATAGVVAGLGAFVAALHVASTTLNEFGQGMRLSGGTARDVAQLGRVGLTGEAAAGAAAGFRQRITTDPMAQMFAARLGVRELPRPFGPANEAQFLVKAIEGLRKLTNAEERLTTARELGLDPLLKYVEAGPQVQALLERQADFAENLAKGAEGANNLSIATESLTRSWQNLLGVVAAPHLLQFSEDLEALAEGLQTGDWSAALYGIQASQTKAIEDNTKAHQDSTDAIKGAFLPAGAYGGGPRTAKAMPSGWAGDFLNRNIEAGALSKGMPGV